jgi:hypothetical protein
MGKKKVEEKKAITEWTIHEMTDLDMAFPASVKEWMPDYDDIPVEFRNFYNKWNRFQRDWFYNGIKIIETKPKPGIDSKAAMRHLGAIQGSFEPKHEHKEAAVAFLASLWFDDVKYEKAK